ncbi:hypothetical protein H6G00_04175 [Leptolyngbya sp. FACHB-541]|uniref:hypothetical protein n=1 Tax=Leptolyngbya sp. FACHB-541 TaxID=2692810 RepID=UPI001687D31D|nr:hypothetical protein [Leptolyngbya sp. FACHB-541]MBD1995823.1 hypothetical protein [Leptolyngbya sp. FACHB-541]
MKLILLTAVTLLSVVGATSAWANTLETESVGVPQGNASQLLLPEQEPEEFEYDGERLNTLENNINQTVFDEDSIRSNIIRPPGELGLPQELIIIDSDNGPAVGTEL